MTTTLKDSQGGLYQLLMIPSTTWNLHAQIRKHVLTSSQDLKKTIILFLTQKPTLFEVEPIGNIDSSADSENDDRIFSRRTVAVRVEPAEDEVRSEANDWWEGNGLNIVVDFAEMSPAEEEVNRSYG